MEEEEDACIYIKEVTHSDQSGTKPLSVFPIPVYVRTRENDHARTLKIL